MSSQGVGKASQVLGADTELGKDQVGCGRR